MSLFPRNPSYNAGPRLLRDIWGLTAVAIVILILRVVAKLRLRKFGTDDILMAFALVSYSFPLPVRGAGNTNTFIRIWPDCRGS